MTVGGTPAPESTVFLGLGSNLGDREANLRAALCALSRMVRIDTVSRVYLSEPVGHREQPDFWNLVVRGRSALAPRALLEAAHSIERELGRTRPFRDAPRPIDIDLLLYGQVRVDEPDLRIPHPRLLSRAFVLRPLVEVAGEIQHPETGRTFDEHWRAAEGLERTEPLFEGERLLER